jgi:flagellar basal-body rod protein FlgF
MTSSVYIALSGQVALERRLNTIANNVANMNTPGFRAEEVRFETFMARAAGEEIAFSSGGEAYTSRRAGPVSPTGNPLDVAVEGDAWLAFASPAGIVNTRDGRLQMTEGGELRTATGYPILDPGGSPIVLDPAAGEVTIATDGAISQGGRQVGGLGLFLIPETSKLTRFESSGVIPSEPAQPVEDTTANSVRQGFIEGANVNPIMEMSKLIMLSRTFDSAASAVEQGESVQQEAIRSLGPS